MVIAVSRSLFEIDLAGLCFVRSGLPPPFLAKRDFKVYTQTPDDVLPIDRNQLQGNLRGQGRAA